jgi:hypothetical protein
MCYHKRIIYSCGHTGFGEEVRSCVAMKKQYCEGQLSGRCNTWKSHALHSLNVQIVCHRCQVKTTKLQEAMLRLKMGTKEQEAKDSVTQDRQKEKYTRSNFHLQANPNHHSPTSSNFSGDSSCSSSNAMLRELFLARKWCTA